MNTTSIKNFATKARKAFLRLVEDKLISFGITEEECPRHERKGDAVIVNGVPYNKDLKKNFDALAIAYKELGYEQLVVSVAHTWFNRFCALRYMEVHDYLPFRVFPEQANSSADILINAVDAAEELSMDSQAVRAMKLAGDKDQELYRLLLLAQCKELSKSLPFLFKSDDQYSELLLPDNLLHTDSIIFNLVNDIAADDWQEIEIIGWLYQYYISEKKDEVIGKVVRKEDIPAATQLFTPNWIVKYMVENSLGRLWLEVNPQSNLAEHMEYYIDTTAANPDYIAPKRDHIQGPEDLKVIDPACGSGHILVYAFDLLFKIYEEAGYIQREIPQKILEYNLYGLDIDERAVQLASFALMMKGRQFDRRLLRVRDDKAHAPHIVEIKESDVIKDFSLIIEKSSFTDQALLFQDNLPATEDHPLQADLSALINLFEGSKNFGSLLTVPQELKAKLPVLKEVLEKGLKTAAFADRHKIEILLELITQAEVLATEYDICVANPPYMGGKGMTPLIKTFVKRHFSDAKSDLFACFIERGFTLGKPSGYSAMVTMQSWMFLSSFEKIRAKILNEKTLNTMTQIGYNSFPSLNSKVAQATVFSLLNSYREDYTGTFVNLNNAPQSADKERVFLEKSTGDYFHMSADEFKKIPGAPLAYWASSALATAFESKNNIGSTSDFTASQNKTGENARFLRRFWEIDISELAGRWVPYAKGGPFRRWYGNLEYVVDWSDFAKEFYTTNPGLNKLPEKFHFREGISYSDITSGAYSARLLPKGCIYDMKGPTFHPLSIPVSSVLCVLNSHVGNYVFKILNPTLTLQAREVRVFPLLEIDQEGKAFTTHLFDTAVKNTKDDWDAYEQSWNFQSLPILVTPIDSSPTLESNYTTWTRKNRETISEMKRLEEKNNHLFIDAYGLDDELTPEVPIEQITLTVNPAYRYGVKLTEEEQWSRFRQDTMKELISYAIGCMMGRYSLDAPGLIMASAGETLEDYLAKVDKPLEALQFEPDDAGSVPMLEYSYFGDDCYHRLVEFLTVTFDNGTLDENLQFLASHFKPKKNETPETTLRRYLSNQFFKDHLKTYKKRPIYWLVSSGKEKAFQCLVYLHRYTPATLSRMRTTYVRELQNKLHSERDHVEQGIDEAATTSEKNTLGKRLTKLDKQIEELRKFDEKLRHLADKQIDIDLDDGVKHNYGLFGDLLAEVKAVTGKPAVKV